MGKGIFVLSTISLIVRKETKITKSRQELKKEQFLVSSVTPTSGMFLWEESFLQCMFIIMTLNNQ